MVLKKIYGYWSRTAILNQWVSTVGKHVFPVFLGTETPLSSKITIMK